MTIPTQPPAAPHPKERLNALHAVERLDALDALRGLMALAVAVYHHAVWTHVFPAGSRLSNSVTVLGIHSVEGFFILSGFCFFHLYRGRSFTRGELRSFHVKRFFRIAPLYYLAFALTCALDQSPGPLGAARLAENLTLSFGLFHPNHSGVMGGWSIGVEYVFYLAFPLLLWIARLRGGMLLMLLGLGALALFYNYVRVPATAEAARFNAYVLVPNHALLFVVGGALAALRARISLRLTGVRVLLGTLLIAAGFQLWLTPFYDHFDMMMGHARVVCLAACSAVVLLCGLSRSGVGRALRPLVGLGELSYAVYLLHPLAWSLIQRAGWLEGRPVALFVLGLTTTLALAALVHGLFERPLLRLGRRYAEGPTAGAKAAPSADPQTADGRPLLNVS
ncbi:MAG TPA: acyltransferase [Polyangiaceae bacterium]|nr:acyltransferase [Polyangiaceae bacterium]